MEDDEIELICINCGHQNVGQYCSVCGSRLAITTSDFPKLLKQSLLQYGLMDMSNETLINHYSHSQKEMPMGKILLRLNNSKDLFAELLVADHTNLSMIKFAWILNGTSLTEEELFQKVEAKGVELLTAIKSVNKFAKIKTIVLQPFIIFDAIDDLKTTIKNLNNRRRSRFSLKLKVIYSFIGFDLGAGLYHPKFGFWMDPEFTVLINNCFKQLPLVKRQKQFQRKEKSFWPAIYEGAFKGPVKTLLEFGQLFLSVIAKPMHFAFQIEQNKIKLKDAVKYLALLIVFAVFLEKLLGIPGLSDINFFPVIDEILAFLLLFICSIINATFFFIPLRLAKGKGSFLQTITASMIILIATFPLITVSDAVTFYWFKDLYKINVGSFLFFSSYSILTIPFFSIIHKISRRKATIALFLGLFIWILLVVVVIWAYFKIAT